MNYCHLKALLIAFVLLFGVWGGDTVQAGEWRTFDGKIIDAEAVEFDFATKMVMMENPETKGRANYSTRDLDFSSRRKLFLSPVFHRSFPEGSFWSKEKMWLIGIAILSPVVLLVAGMWLAGLFIAKRFNPFSAIGAFLGSWVAGVILIICYFVFAQKGNYGMGIIYFGIVLSALIMALFISAMYRTTFIRGILIFFGHLVFAALLGYILLYGMDKLLPPDQVSAFWQKWVFMPTGLLEGPPRQGY
ncbi:MAG: hypothetical protein P1U89_21380 [Verrucomicrobiales bacterium]|nr:hypothetical protein [Verrucomicrobiales bacterium]